MKKEVSIDSRIYLPPKAWVVEVFSERFICVSANPTVDEIDNQNDNNDDNEDFDIHF